MSFFDWESIILIGLIMIVLGWSGILINKLNILLSILCIEVVFCAVNFLLVVIGLNIQDIIGQIISLFVLTVAASESALALALIMLFFRIFNDILLEKI